MQPPKRIASLLPSATEVLWGIGVGERVVAVSHECDFPAEAKQRPRGTRSLIDSAASSGHIDELVRRRLAAGEPLYELDRPLLVRLAPDLIITQAQCDVCAVKLADVLELVRSTPALQGAQVLALQPAGLEDVLLDIEAIGRAAGAEEAARKYVAGLVARIDRVQAVTGRLDRSERPRVVCIEWTDPLMTAGNWVPELVELAGGESLLAAKGQHSPYVSWDQIRAANPEVIVVAPCGFDLPRTLVEAETLRHLPGWKELAAVRNRRVWAVDGNAYFNRSGPRIVDSLEILAHVLHPDCFPLPRSGALPLR
ncbi:MAG TPA: cobalamin-binding protein [Pirellulaceae bacterium]|nr:cobalamin-binding protein [Pirellulaceae bacterium]